MNGLRLGDISFKRKSLLRKDWGKVEHNPLKKYENL